MSEDAPGNLGAVEWPDENAAYFAVRRMQTKLHGWAGADRSRRFDDLFNLAAPRKRPVISPVKPGGTRREVPGSDG